MRTDVQTHLQMRSRTSTRGFFRVLSSCRVRPLVGQGLRTDIVWVDTGSTARPVRMANSTPDVKALFKNAGYVLAEGEETEERTARYSGVSYRPPSDYWPQPVAVSCPEC